MSCHDAGQLFNMLLAQINDSQQAYPEDLKERLAGVLVKTPMEYQYASIAFMERVRSATCSCFAAAA